MVVSHIQYVDDAIFVGSCSVENAKNLTMILRWFEFSLGLKVNLNKRKLFSYDVKSCEINLVSHSTNYSVRSLLFTYSDLPVEASMDRIVHLNLLINKFHFKLWKWKAFTLSFGGWLTLRKSILGSLGTFRFSLYKAFSKVMKCLEKIRMRLLWDGDFKKACIACDKILASKERGGLGIGSLKVQTVALLSKWWLWFKK